MSLSFVRRLSIQSSVSPRFAVGTVTRRYKSDTCKVLTISSGKGGVGKTTTAASFSYGLAQKVPIFIISYLFLIIDNINIQYSVVFIGLQDCGH
jgi:Mrp family chromosome partitioning ATPase